MLSKIHDGNGKEDSASALFPCRFIISIQRLSGYTNCKYKRQPDVCVVLEMPVFLSNSSSSLGLNVLHYFLPRFNL